MPELPEVETVRRGLGPGLANQRITGLHIRNAKLRWPVPKTLSKEIVNFPILSIQRRAKYLLFEFPHGYQLVHLGMSGRLFFCEANHPLDRHDHVIWQLTDGSHLRYRDPRRFGCVLWLSDLSHPLLKHLGPEPLSEKFNAKYLYACCQKRKSNIKTVLMDQKVVVGVGNIYTNEVLFEAGIHPLQPANLCSLEACKKLHHAIRKIIQRAIEKGGTTLKDFYSANGKAGYFQQQLFVYGRADKPCLRCKKTITQIRIQNRSSFYCEQCQPLA